MDILILEYGLFLLFTGMILPVLLGSALRFHSVGLLLALLFLQGLEIADTLFTAHVERFLSSFYALMDDSGETRFFAYISGRIFVVIISLLPFGIFLGVLFYLAFTKLDEEQVQKLKRWTKMDRKAQHITGAISMGIVAYIVTSGVAVHSSVLTYSVYSSLASCYSPKSVTLWVGLI